MAIWDTNLKLQARKWDESKRPRVPKGNRGGGRWTRQNVATPPTARVAGVTMPRMIRATPQILPDWVRPATQPEIDKVAQDYAAMPPEIRKWGGKGFVFVGILKPDSGHLARAEGNVVHLEERDVVPGSPSATNQHELRHALCDWQVTRSVPGGAEAMYKELMRSGVRMDIHANQMYEEGGRNREAQMNEWLGGIGDRYGSGQSEDQMVEVLANGRPYERMQVEAKLGSGQTSWTGSEYATRAEVETAVRLWRKWYQIDKKEFAAPGERGT